MNLSHSVSSYSSKVCHITAVAITAGCILRYVWPSWNLAHVGHRNEVLWNEVIFYFFGYIMQALSLIPRPLSLLPRGLGTRLAGSMTVTMVIVLCTLRAVWL